MEVWTGGRRWRRLRLLRLRLLRLVLWCVVVAPWVHLMLALRVPVVLVCLIRCVSGLMIAWMALLR